MEYGIAKEREEYEKDLGEIETVRVREGHEREAVQKIEKGRLIRRWNRRQGGKGRNKREV